MPPFLTSLYVQTLLYIKDHIPAKGIAYIFLANIGIHIYWARLDQLDNPGAFEAEDLVLLHFLPSVFCRGWHISCFNQEGENGKWLITCSCI